MLFARIVVMAAALAAAAACGKPPDSPPPSKADQRAANEAAANWQAKHEVDYRRDWVTIAALHDLKPGVNTAGSAPTNDIILPAPVPAMLGRFIMEGQQVRFEPARGALAIFVTHLSSRLSNFATIARRKTTNSSSATSVSSST